jgi:TPR repeat protein
MGTCVSPCMGEGVAAPDYPAAAVWYTRAVDAGTAANIGTQSAAANLSDVYAVGRGRDWQIMPSTSSAASQSLVS